ncbi:MAG: aminotransferase class V-fold PLP-dependent enzyme [Candidatus Hodarchaeota archaeon]
MFDVEAIRKQFPILQRRKIIYLDSACTTLKPQKVIDSILYYYSEITACAGRSIHTMAIETTEAVEHARKTIARFIQAEPNELIFTKNTTEGINLVSFALDLKKDDRIITSDLEHHSNLLPWQFAQKRYGTEFIPLQVDCDGNLDLNQLTSSINERTRLIALQYASNILGTSFPIKEIAKIAHEHDTLLLVDGAQAVQHFPVDVKDLGIDFLAFSSHKMCGPTGIGVLFGREELLSEMEPFLVGGETINEVELDHTTLAAPPKKYEAGIQHYAGIIGLGAACDFLTDIGMDNIITHEQILTKHALSRLSELENQGKLVLYGPKDVSKRIGIMPFNLKNTEGDLVNSHDVSILLNETKQIAIRSGFHCVQPFVTRHCGIGGSARASFYLYNTLDEIDILADALTEAATIF